MQLVGSRAQQQVDDYFDYSGTIATGGTPQLLMPQRKSCSHLVIANLSAEALNIQFGVLPATAGLTNGAVTSVTVNDAGFGFLVPPEVMFLGGGNAGDVATQGATMPDWPAPFRPAKGRAILTAGAISSIEIDDPGSGYLAVPYVAVRASRRDPNGVGIPSATRGIQLPANTGIFVLNGTSCPTVAISVYGGTAGQAYTAKWMS